MRIILLTWAAGLLLFSNGLQAQSYWQTINKNTIPQTLTQELQPTRSQLLSLDLPAIRQALLQVPHETNSSLYQSNAIFALPMQDGSMQDFRLIEYDAMAPGLMVKFPDFHTYYGMGLSDPNLRVRVDITAKGVRVMGTSSQGQWFVDPYAKGNTEYYIAYAKADYPAQGTWQCEFDDSMVRPSGNAPTSSTRAGDCSLRIYRLAVAARGEYTAFHGGLTNAMAEIVNLVNRINEIYERDLTVRLQLIPNNDLIVYPNASTDPYSGGLTQNLNQNQNNLNNVIGSANYDVGHVISANGGGGLAGLGVVCGNNKARGGTSLPNPVGDPFAIDYMAHELGHQFGGNHTQNNNCQRAGIAAYEPGSASTIMGYAGICSPNVQNNSDAMFHSYSMFEMQQEILSHGCPFIISTGNLPPVVDAGMDYIIPHSTPFVLTATASDPNNDNLTYSWEQWDNEIASMPPSAFSNSGPSFRVYLPTPSPERTIPRLLTLVNNTTPTWERLSSVTRTYNFRATVRDNAPGISCTTEDDMQVNVLGTAGPFVVTQPNSPLTWPVGSLQTVAWDVANTDLAPINCQLVDIYLSTDGGFTYPILLASQSLNDGMADIQVPNVPGTTNRVRVQAHDNIFFDISNQNFTITAATAPAIALNMAPSYGLLCSQDILDVQITLDSIAGATGPVDINVFNVPVGVNINLSTAQANLPDTIIANISSLPNAVPGIYSIFITADNNNGSMISRAFDLEVSAASIAPAPIIAIPGNQARNIVTRPTFLWPPAMGNGFYDLEVSLSPAFDTLTLLVEAFSGTQIVSPVELESGQVYYWRIRTYNECGPGPYSVANTFQTGVKLCTEYVSGFFPVLINNVGTPTVGSLVIVPDSYTISDVNIKNLDISHDNIEELSVEISKPGDTSVLLFANSCSNTQNFYNSFDGLGLSAPINCPADDSLTYKPLGDLSDFEGINSSGAWTLQITDNADGGGGFVNGWALEICKDTLPPSDPNLLNQPINVLQGEEKLLPNTRLLATAANLMSEDVSFTLQSLPAHGNLLLNSQVLGLGDQFTQADIDNAQIFYQHDSSTVLTDAFLFSILDANGGWIPLETFNINVWLTDLEDELPNNIQWQFHPNPAQDHFTISMSSVRPETLKLRMLNLTGQEILQEDIYLNAGNTFHKSLSSQNMASGVYFLEVSGTGFKEVKKIVIAH